MAGLAGKHREQIKAEMIPLSGGEPIPAPAARARSERSGTGGISGGVSSCPSIQAKIGGSE